jgi:hypothetical protein
MREMVIDRRKQPTPILSRYTLGGRRADFHGEIGVPKERYVDRYSPSLLFALLLIVGLNYLDSCFTMMILENGGREINPLVESIIFLLGEKFWIWKFVLVSFSAIILCLHSHYRGVKMAIVLISFLYVALVSYQIFGLAVFNI